VKAICLTINLTRSENELTSEIMLRKPASQIMRCHFQEDYASLEFAWFFLPTFQRQINVSEHTFLPQTNADDSLVVWYRQHLRTQQLFTSRKSTAWHLVKRRRWDEQVAVNQCGWIAATTLTNTWHSCQVPCFPMEEVASDAQNTVNHHPNAAVGEYKS